MHTCRSSCPGSHHTFSGEWFAHPIRSVTHVVLRSVVGEVRAAVGLASSSNAARPALWRFTCRTIRCPS
jgi:hypothetical protein